MPRGTPKQCYAICLIGEIEVQCQLKPNHQGHHLHNGTDAEDDYTQIITIVWSAMQRGGIVAA